ncbi:MAG: hypothetical protein WA919_15055 [Coleofasciculaceae cyanobacterium]
MVYLSFYVQNFTEDVPTLILKNARTIKPSDIEGQELIQKIDSLLLQGIELSNEPHIRIVHNRRAEFYIKVITDQEDLSGRPATIGIYGKLPSLTWEYSFEDWFFNFISKVKELSSEIDRSLQPEHLRKMRIGLKTLSSTYKQRLLSMYIGKLILGFILPIIVGLLLQFFPVVDSRTVLLVSCLISINNILMALLMQEKNL